MSHVLQLNLLDTYDNYNRCKGIASIQCLCVLLASKLWPIFKKGVFSYVLALIKTNMKNEQLSDMPIDSG